MTAVVGLTVLGLVVIPLPCLGLIFSTGPKSCHSSFVLYSNTGSGTVVFQNDVDSPVGRTTYGAKCFWPMHRKSAVYSDVS